MVVVADHLQREGGVLMGSPLKVGVPITHRDRLPSSSRYELLVKIASGGMATVYVGRLSSVAGTSRLVAIKRAHAHLLEDPAFGRMLIAEAKLASRIHHPNVVAVQSVEEVEGELLLVMDYVEGASLADLLAFEDMPLPAKVAVRALLDGCAGLQAAHELTDDDGKSLGIVHRDVSPHNILVGVDGVGRLTDFGIAKSSGHTASAGQQTSTGALKGKVAYMAPEYVEAGMLDARSDVFSLGVVAWEALTRKRLFRGATEIESLRLVLATEVLRASEVAPWVGRALDGVIMKALARAPQDRFSTAAELGEALEIAARREDLIATASQVGVFVRSSAGDVLARRRALIRVPADQETITIANARYDDATRGAVAKAIGGDANALSAGRADDTAALAPDAAEVRPRESVTAAIAASPSNSDLVASSTAPLVDASSVRELIAREASAPDGSTLGGGVSAQTVDDARATVRAGGSRRGLVAFVVAVGCAIGGAALVIPAVRKSVATVTVEQPSARLASTPTAETALASASAVPTSPPAASTAALPAATASASTTSTVTASPIASTPKVQKGHVVALPIAAPPTRLPPPAHAKSAAPPADPPGATGDRAPPNPYAH